MQISNIQADLQTVGWLCDGKQSAAKAAASRGVEITPLDWYSSWPTGAAGIATRLCRSRCAGEIRRGVRELAAVLEGS